MARIGVRQLSRKRVTLRTSLCGRTCCAMGGLLIVCMLCTIYQPLSLYYVKSLQLDRRGSGRILHRSYRFRAAYPPIGGVRV